MKLLQRYIFFELLKVFLFVLTILTILLVFVGVFREVSQSGLGPLHVLQILPFIVPSMLPFTIPATLLLTVCLVYGRISGDQEVTAAKAAGVSALSLIWPSILLGLALSGFSYVLTDQAIPWAMTNIQRIGTAAMEDIFLDVLRSHHFIQEPDQGIEITVMGVEDRTLIMPTFRYKRAGKRTVTIQAQTAQMKFDIQSQHVMLKMEQGHINVPGKSRVYFEHVERPFPLPHQSFHQPKARHLRTTEIRKAMASMNQDFDQRQEQHDIEVALSLALGHFDRLHDGSLANLGVPSPVEKYHFGKLHTELHSRVALSCSCFFFVLLGSPFSILQARRQVLTNFLLCFLPILVVYYPVVLLMANFCKTGVINPAWGMWMGNLVLLAGGLFILRRVLRH